MKEATTIGTVTDLLDQYGCGPIRFSGNNDALYERHLLFDDIIAPAAAGAREQFEAAARSGRDVLSQRWVLTESTYDSRNPKRIYYLSMEFLAKAEPAGPLRAAWSWLKQTDLIPIKALPLAFPPSAHLLLSGNDFSGYFGRSFWSAPSG